MKSSVAYSVFILIVACSLTVQGQQQGCSCGNLGSGTNPCTCSETVVKAAKLPTPTYYVPPKMINEAVIARSNIVVPTGVAQNGFPNMQSISNFNPIIYNNAKPKAYISSNNDAIAYNDDSSNVQINSDSNVSNNNNDDSSDTCNNGGGTVVVSNSDSDTFSDSDSIVYDSKNPSISPATSVTYTSVASSDNTGTPLEVDGSTTSNSDVNVVPSFSPIGDLCYPLPIHSRSGILLEKTKVTPAYPGKIVCNRCNPSEPYEICVNMLNGETTSRKVASISSDATSGPSSIIYGASNTGVLSGTPSGALNGIGSGSFGNANSRMFIESTSGALNGIGSGSFGNANSRVFSESTSGATGGIQYELFGNGNSGAFSKSTSGAIGGIQYGLFGNGNSGAFSKSTSGAFSGPQFGRYIGSNVGSFGQSGSGRRVPTLAYSGFATDGRNQYERITANSGSSNCFDDDTDETQVDYSYPEVPADAVSLTLAYKNLRAPNVIYRQGKQFVPEDKLSFGHRTVPNDVNNVKKIVDIPEERLVTVEKPVVELKVAPPRTVVIGSYDEREEAKLAELEAIERESITQEEAMDQVAESLVTYKDLGYAPVGSTFAKSHSEISNGELNDSMEEPCGPLGPPIPDYIPGSVTIQQKVVKDNFANAAIGGISDNMGVERTIPSRFRSCSN